MIPTTHIEVNEGGIWGLSGPSLRLSDSPFALANDAAYRHWRELKLRGYPHRARDLRVEVRDLEALRPGEREALLTRLRKANAAIYVTDPEGSRASGKGGLKRLGSQLGLTHLDGNLCADEDAITSLRTAEQGRRRGYIPYSNRPLSWHTDGYYNPPDRAVRAWLLHCAQDAAEGGENALLDCEIAYISMRDEDPALVAALMQPDVMTIPANEEDGLALRGAQSGPVFWVDPETGSLQMRYTARRRNIVWKEDPRVRAAVARLERLWELGSRFMIRYRLRPGEGILSNNSLHNRTGFRDDPQTGHVRLLYRARYYERIAGTDLHSVDSRLAASPQGQE